MGKKIPENFRSLVGTIPLGHFDPGKFDTTCGEMRRLGFTGVYFNDIFFEAFPAGSDVDKAALVFADDDMSYVARPKRQLAELRGIVRKHGMTIPSSHFLQTLPPPGESLEWIFPWHEKLLDVAEFLGMTCVTTHIGSMLGLPCERYMGEKATLFHAGKITCSELYAAGKEVYGRDKLLPDLLAVYRCLCAAAAKRGIRVSVETAVSELPEVSYDIDRMLRFVADIGAPNLGVCVDSGHCHFEHLDILDVIRKMGPLFIETHFHDNFGDRDSHYPAGIGTIHWREVINAMVDSAYGGLITFEQSNHPVNSQNWKLFLEAVEKDWNVKPGKS
ncbi:MAG: hypothetical protein A3K18_29090 [Lentisphaerae bacterium RIFOXYA12_64_32]|nr:MAG: hypothetical protein A3K18_29090 [Lentisphaerae bacterium RIFOXYA12_64_32]